MSNIINRLSKANREILAAEGCWMRNLKQIYVMKAVLLLSTVVSPAQQTVSANGHGIVPPLVNFNGFLTDMHGKPLTEMTGVTFSLYKNQDGGTPLWTETQNVQPDQSGHYWVLLGSNTSTGLSSAVFATGEARWLGVEMQGQPEQPRVVLVSVPYALKAVDAQTVGGLPPSAFLLAPPDGRTAPASVSRTASVSPALGGSGTADFIPLWIDSLGNLGNSVMFQSGSGSTARIGINTTTPAETLDVEGAALIRGVLLPNTSTATASSGFNSYPVDLLASSFNSSTGKAVNQIFQWQAEPIGNNTSSPFGTLNLLYGAGVAPAETGLNIGSNGQITFAPGQTFPGTGTITGVTTTAGSGLIGGGTTGTLNLALSNTCAANQVLQWNGAAWACATISGGGSITAVTAGTDLSGGGTSGNVTLNLNTTSTDARYAQLGANNVLTGVQTVNNREVIAATSTSGTLVVTQSGTQATGDGIHGITNATGGTGVFGQGAIGLQGLASTANGFSGLFRGTVKITGNGNNLVAGDPGCGSGYAALGFLATGILSGCTNYAVAGGSGGGTFINSSGTASIHFRSNNNELATIDNSGNVKVIGQNGGGNLTVAGQTTISTANSAAALVVTNTASGTGVQGTAGNGRGGLFVNNSTTYAALQAQNNADNKTEAFWAGGGPPTFGLCTIDTSGNLLCFGSKSAVVRVDRGARRVALYAVEAPENWFEDVGSAQLSNGSARINLDSTFAQTVNTGVEYHVFLTPKGDCKGLYVGNESGNSFEVHELGGGTSNIAFDYRIMAKRSGYEQIRLADHTERFKRLEAQQILHSNEQRQPQPAAAQETAPSKLSR